MAYNLFEECKERLVSLLSNTDNLWDKLYKILEFAFSVSDDVSKVIDSLEPTVDWFRNSNKAPSDVYELFKVIHSLPWVVQKTFLKTKGNSDIAEALKGQTEEGLERLVFEERRAAGEKLFKKIGLPEGDFIFRYNSARKKYEETYLKILKVCEDYQKCDVWDNLGKDKLRVEYNALKDEYAKLEKKFFDEKSILMPKMTKSLSNLKENLLQQSKISQKEADEWVNNNVNIETTSMKKVLSKWKKDTNK